MAITIWDLDSYIEVTSDEVGVVGGVHNLSTTADCANLHYSDNLDLTLSWHWTTLWDSEHPKLPALELSAESGKRATLDEELTGLEITARSGAVMQPRPNLPVLESSGVMSAGSVLAGDNTLPMLTASARGGSRSEDLKLPTLDVSLSMTGTGAGVLDKTLPGLTVTATGSTPVLSTLVKDLPALTMTGEVSFATTATLAKTLPALLGSATGLSGGSITLDGTLPALEIALAADASMVGDALSLAATLPTLVMGGVPNGIPGVVGSMVTVEDRFTDYVLRHIR